MRFSERYGFKPLRQVLQIDSVDSDLRNGLWNTYYRFALEEKGDESQAEEIKFERLVWGEFLKLPSDRYSSMSSGGFISDWFLGTALWYQVYDFIEFVGDVLKRDREGYSIYKDRLLVYDRYIKESNRILEREMSAYRFINGMLSRITSEEEIAAVEEATSAGNTKWGPVTEHLRSSQNLVFSRQNPDFRNSVKEAISAVESACKLITQNPKATLGDTLKTLERGSRLHPAFKGAFDKLYGYTSDAGGIRHALLENDYVVTFEDAKFMLVTCSAFINYLKSQEL